MVQVTGRGFPHSALLYLSGVTCVFLSLNSSELAVRGSKLWQPVLQLCDDDRWQLETGSGTTTFIFMWRAIGASFPQSFEHWGKGSSVADTCLAYF